MSKLISEMENLDYTKEDFIEVSENNIDKLLENDEEDNDEYCNDENLKFSFE